MDNLFTKESLSQLTADLIKFKTVAGNNSAFESCIEYIKKYFQDTGLIMREIESNGNRNLVVLTKETNKPQVFLAGHVDVVGGDDSQFNPAVRDGRLYGRGACDMKSGVAVLMQLMRHFAQCDDKPDIGLMITTDEERGGENGVGHLLNNLEYRAGLAIIPDGGNAPDEVIVKNKGFLHLKITSKGLAAHASRPWEGKSAIHELMDKLQQIKELYPDTHEQWTETANIGTINGGKAANQVADTAAATLDIRYTEKTTAENILSSLRNILQDSNLEVLIAGNLNFTDEQNPLLQKYAEILKSEMNLNAKFMATPGGNDGRYFSKYQIPVLISRPKSAGLHGPEEWVLQENLEQYAKIYLKYLNEILMKTE